ncbi:gliding motility-associated peptidyl-prolyl isomerase GldI [Zunongwangia sp. H14]|uniref:gliding motility-associated peptidyl-prolyl isomerase GldI n=1 Tax=Zunongwangia sp. H14 TaxID=3240792 RepID=UPI0035659A29
MKFRVLIILFLATVSCKSPEARRPVSQSSGSYIDQSVERNKALLSQEEAYITKIMERDSTRDYIASNNGFWYFYNERNTDSTNTQTPEFGDILIFDYTISTLDGKPIYAEGEKATREYAVDQEELFTGLREGLKLMKEGETVTFLFPSYKAYGYYGDKAKIGTNLPITTKVTLHSIKSKTSNESNN